jgi:hypothetical protein
MFLEGEKTPGNYVSQSYFLKMGKPGNTVFYYFKNPGTLSQNSQEKILAKFLI